MIKTLGLAFLKFCNENINLKELLDILPLYLQKFSFLDGSHHFNPFYSPKEFLKYPLIFSVARSNASDLGNSSGSLGQ